jgi:hypothetical protein
MDLSAPPPVSTDVMAPLQPSAPTPPLLCPPPPSPKSKPWAAPTPAAATSSAAPPKKKQVVKRKAKSSFETTTVDPEASGDFAEHNMFNSMPERYKVLTPRQYVR